MGRQTDNMAMNLQVDVGEEPLKPVVRDVSLDRSGSFHHLPLPIYRAALATSLQVESEG
jgi:hypothetical protein